MRALAASLAVVVAFLVASSAACVPERPGAEGEGEGEGASSGEGEGSSSSDGTAQRVSCTNNFGAAVSQNFGRLDGFLVSLVPTSASGCRADNNHLHLQILTGSNEITDVAVNLDNLTLELHHAPKDTWTEGWHTDASLDYPSDLGVHSSDFTQKSQSQTESDLEAALANANHVSIYAKGYGTDGIHDVHRNGSSEDGAIVVDPTESTSLFLIAHFSNQSF
jgi:hypothetical protein